MPPPNDPVLRKRIEDLSAFLAQKDANMHQYVRERFQANPDFAFLDGGEGADHYLECLCQHLSVVGNRSSGGEAAPCQEANASYTHACDVAKMSGDVHRAHDYHRDPTDTAEIDVRQVDELLSARRAAFRSGNYLFSDRLRMELTRRGVQVLDYHKMWRVNPSFVGTPWTARTTVPIHSYLRYEADTHELDTEDLRRIEELLSERLAAKRAHQYYHADMLCERLRVVFNVRPLDRTRQWCVDRRGALTGREGVTAHVDEVHAKASFPQLHPSPPG